MKAFDLNKIMEVHKLEVHKVAKHLFPANKYPKLALDRILKNEAFLDTNQLSRLAQLIGTSIENLYSNNEWSMKTKKGLLHFTSDKYTAELNTNSWTTKIYSDGSIFHEEVIHNGSITLSEYLQNYREVAIDEKLYQAYLKEKILDPAEHHEFIALTTASHRKNLVADPETGYASGLDRSGH